MVERIYTFDQVAEHLQGLVTVNKLKTWARAGLIETTPFGRGRGMNESQLNKLIKNGVPTTEQRRRPQPKPKVRAAAKQPKPVRQPSPVMTSSAAEPLVFDRSRSRKYRAGGAA